MFQFSEYYLHWNTPKFQLISSFWLFNEFLTTIMSIRWWFLLEYFNLDYNNKFWFPLLSIVYTVPSSCDIADLVLASNQVSFPGLAQFNGVLLSFSLVDNVKVSLVFYFLSKVISQVQKDFYTNFFQTFLQQKDSYTNFNSNSFAVGSYDKRRKR